MFVVKKENRLSNGWKNYSFLRDDGRFGNNPRFFSTNEEAKKEASKHPQSYAWEWGIDPWMN